MAAAYINPMSFKVSIKVNEDFVVQMIVKYLELEVETFGRVKGPSKGEFNEWYRVQIMLFGIDEESQGLQGSTTVDAFNLFNKWYGTLA